MKIVSIGSLNVDHVYQVDHFVRPGESLISGDYARFAGGKGANQALAAARGGAQVLLVGKIGGEGDWMIPPMERDGVDVCHILVSEQPGGHAIIQVDPSGENAIVVFGGTNQQIHAAEIASALDLADPEDYVLLQNEINDLSLVINEASSRGLRVAFNAGPMTPGVHDYPLQDVSLLFINETEGEDLTGTSDPDEIVVSLIRRYPAMEVVVTLGADGVLYAREDERLRLPGRTVDVVDTTGAGDTFIGYYMAGVCEGLPIEAILALATEAAALCVTRHGAAASIPYRRDLSA